MKIRNKKTGEIVEVKDPKELAKYGIKLPKAKMGVQYMDGETGANLVIPEQDSFNPEGNQLMLNTFNKYGISPTQPFQGVGYNNQLMQNPFGYPTENINVESFGLGDNKLEPLKTNTKDNFSRMPEKVKINQKAPKLFPVTGNKYFNRGLTYLNQAIKHGSNINNPNPDMSPDYNGIMSPLQTFSEGGFNQNGFNNIMQGVAAGVNTLQSGINFGKGALDIIGSQNQNRQIQNFENQLYTQSVFNDAMQTVPQDYIYNRNQLFSSGGSISDFKAYNQGGLANVEVEGGGGNSEGEHILLPNGFSDTVTGETHNRGGVKMNLPQGSKVFSEKLQIETPKGKKSYADLAKKFETKKNVDLLNSKYGDDIQKNTANMIIKFKNQKLDELFEEQEIAKLSGKHGKEVQMNALEDYTMKYGGMKKMGNGGENGKDWVMRLQKGYDLNAIDQVRRPYVYLNDKGEANYDYKSFEFPEGMIYQQFPDAPTFEYKNGKWQVIGKIDPSYKNYVEEKLKNPQQFKSYFFTINDAYNQFQAPDQSVPLQQSMLLPKEDYSNIDPSTFEGEYFRTSLINSPIEYVSTDENGDETWRRVRENKDYSKADPTLNFKNPQYLEKNLPPSFKTNTLQSVSPQLTAITQNPLNSSIKPNSKGKFKTFNTKYNKKTETGVDVTTDPPTEQDWQNSIIPSWYNYSEGNLPYLTDAANQSFGKAVPKNLRTNEALLQETMYDSLLDRLDPKQNFTQAERDAALMQFKNMWGKTGRVTFNNKDKYKKPDINSWKAGDENTYKELANLRGNFIDSKLEKRFLLPVNKPNNFSQNPAKTENKNSQEPTIKTEYKFVDKPIANLPNVNIPLALPNVYSRIPNNYYKINPEFIDPRYLNVQDQLNEINRGTRAFQSNLGSRGTSDISNLLQSQINAQSAKNQVFGNKYNYDRQQDSQAQQFNAQAKMNTAQYNQQSWFNQLEDPIRRRESAIGDQELTDINRGTDNYNKAIQFQNNLKYLQDTVPFYSKMTPQEKFEYAQMMLPGLNNPYADTKTTKTTDAEGKTKTTQTSQKYGGKIKLKPKLKKK